MNPATVIALGLIASAISEEEIHLSVDSTVTFSGAVTLTLGAAKIQNCFVPSKSERSLVKKELGLFFSPEILSEVFETYFLN